MAKPKVKTDRLQDREVSTSELALIVGKSPQWIRQLTRDNILVQVGRGKYSLGESIQAYIKHVEGESSDGKISYRDEKAAHEQIKKKLLCSNWRKSAIICTQRRTYKMHGGHC
ncbi:hypothetical protein [Brevibacillus fortis]|uniref:hypothetical protein n=1 Tax=Brevibacillus fortis TaxID=2126352 RepID=UPI0038FC6588